MPRRRAAARVRPFSLAATAAAVGLALVAAAVRRLEAGFMVRSEGAESQVRRHPRRRELRPDVWRLRRRRGPAATTGGADGVRRLEADFVVRDQDEQRTVSISANGAKMRADVRRVRGAGGDSGGDDADGGDSRVRRPEARDLREAEARGAADVPARRGAP